MVCKSNLARYSVNKTIQQIFRTNVFDNHSERQLYLVDIFEKAGTYPSFFYWAMKLHTIKIVYLIVKPGLKVAGNATFSASTDATG